MDLLDENWKIQSNDNNAINTMIFSHTIIMFWRRGWISEEDIDRYTTEAKANIDIISGNKDVSTIIQFNNTNTKCPYNTAIIKLNYENKSINNIKFHSKYMNDTTYKLVIMMDNLDEAIPKNNHMQIIPYKHMCFRDPLAHISQPIPNSWRVLSREEKQEINNDFTNNRLREMSIIDRIAVYMYFTIGDIVEYECYSPAAGKTLSWVRIV